MTVKKDLIKNMVEKPYLQALVSFGLSGNEARVYVYLLGRGTEAGGSKIALGAKIHRQYVYIALHRLIEMGLVDEIRYGKHGKYKARPPVQLEKIAKKKMVEAEEIVSELQKFSKVGHEQDFEIIQGISAMQDYEVERVASIPEGTEQYFIGGASQGFFDMMAGSYEQEYAPIANRKKLKSYYIGYKEEYNVAENAQVLKRQHFEFRWLPKFPKGVVNIMIMNDTVSFYTFVNPPILYVVKSKIVADNFKQFFMMLWDMAKNNGEYGEPMESKIPE